VRPRWQGGRWPGQGSCANLLWPRGRRPAHCRLHPSGRACWPGAHLETSQRLVNLFSSLARSAAQLWSDANGHVAGLESAGDERVLADDMTAWRCSVTGDPVLLEVTCCLPQLGRVRGGIHTSYVARWLDCVPGSATATRSRDGGGIHCWADQAGGRKPFFRQARLTDWTAVLATPQLSYLILATVRSVRTTSHPGS